MPEARRTDSSIERASERAVAKDLSPRFSSLEVVGMTGVSLRQLQWWDEQGVVTPVQHARRRLYSPGEVLLVGIIVSLRRKGLSLQKIRRVFARIEGRDAFDHVLVAREATDVYLLTDGHRVFLESSPQAIVDVLRQADKPLLAVCISELVKTLGLEQTGSVRKPIRTETELGNSRNGRGSRSAAAS